MTSSENPTIPVVHTRIAEVLLFGLGVVQLLQVGGIHQKLRPPALGMHLRLLLFLHVLLDSGETRLLVRAHLAICGSRLSTVVERPLQLQSQILSRAHSNDQGAGAAVGAHGRRKTDKVGAFAAPGFAEHAAGEGLDGLDRIELEPLFLVFLGLRLRCPRVEGGAGLLLGCYTAVGVGGLDRERGQFRALARGVELGILGCLAALSGL